MGSLGDYLMEELSLKTSFTIPIGGGTPVPQSAVTTWVIYGNRSVALHHIRTEPESHTRRTASLCGSLSWFHL